MITEDNNMVKSKNQNQKIKLNSQKEVIAALKIENETKSAELAEVKAKLAELKATISIQIKDLSLYNSENKDLQK